MKTDFVLAVRQRFQKPIALNVKCFAKKPNRKNKFLQLKKIEMKKFIQNIKGFFAKANVSSCKKWLPKFHAYQHNNGVSITPHLGYQWFKFDGYKTEGRKGYTKAQIHLGWIMWSCQLRWEHDA